MKILKVIISAVCILGMGTGSLNAQQIYYSGGLQWATGSYFFTGQTQSLYFTNSIQLQYNSIEISVSVPMVYQNSPWISYTAAGQMPTGGPQSGNVGHGTGSDYGMGSMQRRGHRIDLPDTLSYNKFGIGDPVINIGYNLLNLFPGATAVQFMASGKLPFTNPENGFGTGGWDIGIGVSLSQRFNTWFFYGNLMHWYFEDMPDLDFENSWNYGFGVGKSLNNGMWMVLASFNGMTTIIDNIDPPLSSGLGINFKGGKMWSVNANAYWGLTESSSDISVGMGWQLRLN